MARVPVAVTNFSAGELSPKLRSRIDLTKYYNGGKTLTNVWVNPQGGAQKRPGTRYVGANPTPFSGTLLHKCRLFPFEYSIDDAYVVAAHARTALTREGLFEFYRDRAIVDVDAYESGSNISNAFFASDLSSWTDSSTGGSVAWTSENFGAARFSLGTAHTDAELWQTTSGTWPAGSAGAVRIDVYDPQTGHCHTAEGATNDPRIRLRVGNSGVGSAQYIDQFLCAGFHVVPFTTVGTNTITITLTYENTPDAGSYDLDVGDCMFIGQEASPSTPRAVQISHPYTGLEFRAIQTAQSADVLYMVHGSHWPQILERFDDTEWTLRGAELIGPFGDLNTETTTLAPSHTTGTQRTITASAVDGINQGDGFLSTDVGRQICIDHSGTLGVAVITAVGSTTSVTVDVLNGYPFGGTTGQTDWYLGAFSDTTGHPAAVGFHEGRLLFGGTTAEPSKFWASASNDFNVFLPGTDDGDAYAYAITNGKFNHIRWLESGTDLLIGTGGGEWRATGGTTSPITPTNIDVKPQTIYGSALIQAVTVSGAALFVQRSGRKVRELTYQFENDAYNAPDLTILSDHLTNTNRGTTADQEIVEAVFQREPWGMLHCVLDDGDMLTMTYEREQEVVAWSRLETEGVFESVAVIPSSAGGGYELWVACGRGTSPNYNRTIEYFDTGWLDAAQAWYVDCGLTDTGSGLSRSAPTGFLGFGVSDTVSALVDGALHDAITAEAGGDITLDYDGSVVTWGLPFTPTVETMGLNQAQATTPLSQRGLGRVGVMLWESLEPVINGKRVADRDVDDDMDTAPPLFTGMHVIPDDGWDDDDKTVTVTQDAHNAGPLYVTGVFSNLEVSEE